MIRERVAGDGVWLLCFFTLAMNRLSKWKTGLIRDRLVIQNLFLGSCLTLAFMLTFFPPLLSLSFCNISSFSRTFIFFSSHLSLFSHLSSSFLPSPFLLLSSHPCFTALYYSTLSKGRIQKLVISRPVFFSRQFGAGLEKRPLIFWLFPLVSRVSTFASRWTEICTKNNQCPQLTFVQIGHDFRTRFHHHHHPPHRRSLRC